MPTDRPFYLIGHRGAAGERLENSMAGFHHALGLPIDAVEIDIRENDSSLWVFHDDDLDRLTDHSGSFDDYEALPEVRLHNGEPVPRLRELLDLYWGKMPLNIEIKSISNLTLLLDLLAGYPAPATARELPWVFVSSFTHAYLRELRQLKCPWPLAPLNATPPENTTALIDEIRPRFWHFGDEHVDPALVRNLDAAGIPSLVYTVNDAGRARYLRDNGVAGIFTDEPTRMLRLI